MSIRSILKLIGNFGKGVARLIKYLLGIGRLDKPIDEEVEVLQEFMNQRQEEAQNYLLTALSMVEGHVNLHLMPDKVMFELVDKDRAIEFTHEEVEGLLACMSPEEAANYIESQLHERMN